MEIEQGVVVLYVGENCVFPNTKIGHLNRVGCVVRSRGRTFAGVQFLHGFAEIQRCNLLPLFKIAQSCENRGDPQYVIDVFESQIAESLAAILYSLPNSQLKEIAIIARESGVSQKSA